MELRSRTLPGFATLCPLLRPPGTWCLLLGGLSDAKKRTREKRARCVVFQGAWQLAIGKCKCERTLKLVEQHSGEGLLLIPGLGGTAFLPGLFLISQEHLGW